MLQVNVKCKYLTNKKRQQQIPYHSKDSLPSSTTRGLTDSTGQAHCDTCRLTLVEPPPMALAVWRHLHLQSSSHPHKQAVNDRPTHQRPSNFFRQDLCFPPCPLLHCPLSFQELLLTSCWAAFFLSLSHGHPFNSKRALSSSTAFHALLLHNCLFFKHFPSSHSSFFFLH